MRRQYVVCSASVRARRLAETSIMGSVSRERAVPRRTALMDDTRPLMLALNGRGKGRDRRQPKRLTLSAPSAWLANRTRTAAVTRTSVPDPRTRLSRPLRKLPVNRRSLANTRMKANTIGSSIPLST